MLQLTAGREFSLHHFAAESVSLACALHFRAARHAATPHENGNADHAFVTDQRGFSGGTVFQGINQRDDAAGWKMQKIDMVARLGHRPSQ